MFRVPIAYGAMLGASVLLFLRFRFVGESLHAPAPTNPVRFGSVSRQEQVDTLLHVLVALAAVVITARALGAIFKYLGQPGVIGEVVAGIMLGPSLLGLVAPTAAVLCQPPSVAPYLSVLAQVGVILYMFLVGLHLDASIFQRSRPEAGGGR
jgi:hypothetical protein